MIVYPITCRLSQSIDSWNELQKKIPNGNIFPGSYVINSTIMTIETSHLNRAREFPYSVNGWSKIQEYKIHVYLLYQSFAKIKSFFTANFQTCIQNVFSNHLLLLSTDSRNESLACTAPEGNIFQYSEFHKLAQYHYHHHSHVPTTLGSAAWIHKLT